MKDSLYHSMDAPVAPIENKIEALKPAEKACFVLDLCVASCPRMIVKPLYVQRDPLDCVFVGE